MSENARAVDLETPISTMRERHTRMLADWEASFSTLLNELEEKRALLQEIEAKATSKVEAVQRRVEAQDTLIETLKIEAEKAVTLRKEIHDKDLELEKNRAEIDSKHALIDALRRDVEEIGRLKVDARAKDQEIARLAKEKQHARQRAAKLTEEFKLLNASTLTDIHTAAELETVRAELDARKTLIESLRGDAERAQALEAQLEKKCKVISRLEASIDRHAGTLAESQQSAEELSEDPTAATTPHDMRESLLED